MGTLHYIQMAGMKNKKKAAGKKKGIEMVAEEPAQMAGLEEMMAAEGPVVQAIRIGVDASVKQIELDMNPKANSLEKLLGGPVTFVGMYDDGDLIVMCAKNVKGKVNKYTLPAPFADEKVKGDMMVVKMDSGSEPNSITLKQWNKFVKDTLENPPAERDEEEEDDEELMDEDDSQEEDSDEDGDMELGSDDEEEDQAGAIEAILTSNLMAQFQEQNGKEPNDKEVEDMLASMKESGLYEQAAGRIAALLSGLGGDAEEGEDGESVEDEESEEEEEEAPPPKKKSRKNK